MNNMAANRLEVQLNGLFASAQRERLLLPQLVLDSSALIAATFGDHSQYLKEQLAARLLDVVTQAPDRLLEVVDGSCTLLHACYKSRLFKSIVQLCNNEDWSALMRSVPEEGVRSMIDAEYGGRTVFGHACKESGLNRDDMSIIGEALARAGADMNITDADDFPYIADIIDLLSMKNPFVQVEYLGGTREIISIPDQPFPCQWVIVKERVYWKGRGVEDSTSDVKCRCLDRCLEPFASCSVIGVRCRAAIEPQTQDVIEPPHAEVFAFVEAWKAGDLPFAELMRRSSSQHHARSEIQVHVHKEVMEHFRLHPDQLQPMEGDAPVLHSLLYCDMYHIFQAILMVHKNRLDLDRQYGGQTAFGLACKLEASRSARMAEAAVALAKAGANLNIRTRQGFPAAGAVGELFAKYYQSIGRAGEVHWRFTGDEIEWVHPVQEPAEKPSNSDHQSSANSDLSPWANTLLSGIACAVVCGLAVIVLRGRK